MHYRFIREFPTFKQQQELNWASIHSFSTLCSKGTEVLHNKHISDIEITDAIEELENVKSYLYAMEALMEKIFDIKVAKSVEIKF